MISHPFSFYKVYIMIDNMIIMIDNMIIMIRGNLLIDMVISASFPLSSAIELDRTLT